MSRAPSHDDAQLILRLYDLRRETRLRKARDWIARSFAAESFEDYQRVCPVGSEDHASFRMVLGYWEMAASFITGGVLHRELFFQNAQELLLVWEKVRRLIPEMRRRAGNPILFRHLEQVATDYIEWLDAHAPDFYERYQQRVRAMAAAKGETR
jgi:hypothetical protein